MWRDHLKTKLLQECQVASRQKLILGFSGGPDSLALLHALHVLEQPLVAAHLDHGLRPESAIEAEQAGQEAAFLGVPFLSERKDVGTFAEENRLSVEEAARQLRYAFLFKVAERQGASAVAVAHTADDQVETVLMHLLRGAGMAGLRGMAPRLLPNPWSAEIPLVRPILGIWRLEVLEYCAAQGLQPVQDASNQDTIFFRNRMRQDLVPQLETLAPGFKRRLAQSASLVAADYEVLASLTEATWRRCLSQQAAEYLELSRPAFLVELLSLQRAMLRRAVAELRPEQRDVGFEGVERARDLIVRAEKNSPVDWLAGLDVLVEGDAVWITQKGVAPPVAWPQAPPRAINLEVPWAMSLNPGWRLEGGEGQIMSADDWEQGDANLAWLDLDKSGEELILRRPRPGDRFQPLGLARGTMKLSDFFINEKLPKRARSAWPLICKGEEIVWVPGYRIGHPFRLKKGSRRRLQLQLKRESL